MKTLTLTVLFITCVLLSLVKAQCPANFYDETVEGKCILLVPNPKTYEDARRHCQQNVDVPSLYREPDLVTVKNSVIQEFLKKSIQNASATYNYDRTWIGLQESQTDWKWVSRSDSSYIQAQGCYDLTSQITNDNMLSRFVDMTPGDQASMTNTQCQIRCSQANYIYSAVYFDQTTSLATCMCGSSFDWDNVLGPIRGCDKKCPGNADEECGGFGRLSLYRLKQSTPQDLWHVNEPHDIDNYAKCLTLTDWPDRKWDDSKCSMQNGQSRSHLCKFPASSKQDCEDRGYFYYTGGNICYAAYENSGLSWFDARMDCMKKDGDLLVVDTQDFIDDIKNRSVLKDESPSSKWWIDGASAEWRWVDGTLLGGEFVNWDQGSPGRKSSACALIHVLSGGGGDKGFRWEDSDCSATYPFICETVIPPSTTTSTTTTTTTTTPVPTTPTPVPTTPTPVPTLPTPVPTNPTPTRPTPAPSTPTPSQTPATSTPAPPGPTPTTPAPATPAPATPVPTTQAPETPVPTTPAPSGGTSSTPSPDSSTDGEDQQKSTGEGEDKIFTNGVIVAIVIAGVAVLVATIRLFVYCCQRRNSPADDRQGLSP